MRRQFTELSIKSFPFAEGPQYDVWDANLPRFGLRIGKRTKTFVLNAGKRRITLGRYGVISLKEARDEAKRRIGAKYLPVVLASAGYLCRAVPYPMPQVPKTCFLLQRPLLHG